jgi:hypothetical protein
VTAAVVIACTAVGVVALVVVMAALTVSKHADDVMHDIERADDWTRWEQEVRS